MDMLYYFASILLCALAYAHSYLGERYIIGRLLRRNDLPQIFGSDDFTKRTLRFAWHITSIAWIGIAAILLLMTLEYDLKQGVSVILAATFAAHGLVSLIGSKGKHLSWVLFFCISILLAIPAL